MLLTICVRWNKGALKLGARLSPEGTFDVVARTVQCPEGRTASLLITNGISWTSLFQNCVSQVELIQTKTGLFWSQFKSTEIYLKKYGYK
jgi:hypothetical protein